jgi:hypothetical protein
MFLGCGIFQFAWSLAVISVSASRSLAGEISPLTLGSQWGLQPELFGPLNLNDPRTVYYDLHDAEIQRPHLPANNVEPRLVRLT